MFSSGQPPEGYSLCASVQEKRCKFLILVQSKNPNECAAAAQKINHFIYNCISVIIIGGRHDEDRFGYLCNL